MINIKPSAAIRNNYNEISELCKTTQKPVFLTKNGEGDLVVMDLLTFSKRESILALREKILQSEEDIRNGRTETMEQALSKLKTSIKEGGKLSAG